MDIWQWTLTKEAIAPCFVRDVLAMRHPLSNHDFFWLGHTPCRTVLLVGMVVAVQVYDKRAIYTIDDGTDVIDCVLHYPRTNIQTEPPPPLTEPGYPVRVVGRVARHFHSKQVHADSIDLCPSSLDEIAHLEHVIELHKTKYSRAIPFVPPKPTTRAPPVSFSDPSVFSNTSHPAPTTASYALPAPPLQVRNRPRPISTHPNHITHVPSSPTASSIASSTPSSPCKPHSPAKPQEAPSKPRLRHPSRIHSRDLTANTFRLYLKHYMDNAPPPFSVPSWSSPSCANLTTPRKRTQFGVDVGESDEATPRPRSNAGETQPNESVDEYVPTLGFTLSHLRRVPELALLAARVVRAETRKRDKAERDKTRDSQRTSSTSASSNPKTATDPPRKKIKRLFSWAVVKLYEEGSIVLWDGEARPLPVPPPPGEGPSSMWTLGSVDPSMSTCGSTSKLYDLSASASLYSHYHAPRRHDGEGTTVDADADPADLSDPSLDEEAYVPLTTHLLVGHVKEAVGILRHGRQGARAGGGTALTAGDVLACMKRTDGRWARVGVWAVEDAMAVLRAA